MTTTFAALIPVYNRMHVVCEALDSIADQSRRPDRILIVDDGSKDESAHTVSKWIDAHPEAHAELIRQENRGAAAALALAVERAEGMDYVGVLDTDDLWRSRYVERQLAKLEAAPHAVACTANRRDEEYPAGAASERRFHGIDTDTTTWLLQHGSPGPTTTVMKRQTLLAAGNFDPAIRTGYDQNGMLRLSLHGPWLHNDQQLAIYRHHYADMKKDAPPLSHRFPDRRLIRALNLQRFIDHQGGRDAIPEGIWRKRLAAAWFKAGKQLNQLGRRREAAVCFHRAATLNPRHLRARFTCWLAGATDGPDPTPAYLKP